MEKSQVSQDQQKHNPNQDDLKSISIQEQQSKQIDSKQSQNAEPINPQLQNSDILKSRGAQRQQLQKDQINKLFANPLHIQILLFIVICVICGPIILSERDNQLRDKQGLKVQWVGLYDNPQFKTPQTPDIVQFNRINNYFGLILLIFTHSNTIKLNYREAVQTLN
eukprot:403338755